SNAAAEAAVQRPEQYIPPSMGYNKYACNGERTAAGTAAARAAVTVVHEEWPNLAGLGKHASAAPTLGGIGRTRHLTVNKKKRKLDLTQLDAKVFRRRIP
ncbi:unnamed protein product, partial [Laminaria digitata]